MKYKFFLLILILIILSYNVYSHAETEIEKSNYLFKLAIISVIILILTIYSINKKKLNNKEKSVIFLLMSILILTFTFYLSYTTIKLNLDSATKGPVHWHADFEFRACGEKLDLKDPEGLFNRVGTPVFHEHNDNRIHIEGVVKNLEEINLHEFFETVGLEINNDFIKFRERDLGDILINNCNGKKAETQVFLYKIKNPFSSKNWIYEQIKLKDYDGYVISPYSTVPPGDCIIVEFDKEKEKTEYICETYKTAIKKGDLVGS